MGTSLKSWARRVYYGFSERVLSHILFCHFLFVWCKCKLRIEKLLCSYGIYIQDDNFTLYFQRNLLMQTMIIMFLLHTKIGFSTMVFKTLAFGVNNVKICKKYNGGSHCKQSCYYKLRLKLFVLRIGLSKLQYNTFSHSSTQKKMFVEFVAQKFRK